MATTTATAPIRPTQPATLRDLITEANALAKLAAGYWAAGLMAEWELTDEGVTYRRQVATWNAYVDAVKVERARGRQARVNAREVAKVRAAACPVCTGTHAGEC